MAGAELQATDDAELVRRAIAAQGDPQALTPVFAAIADQYSYMVLSWCAGRGLDHQAAQDVGQTVLLDAFTSLARAAVPGRVNCWAGGWRVSSATARSPGSGGTAPARKSC